MDTFWLIVMTLAAIVGIGLELLWRLIAWGSDVGRSWVIEIDEDAGNARITRRRLVNGVATDKRNKRALFVSGESRLGAKQRPRLGYSTKIGSLHLLDAQTGLNLRGPTSKEKEAHPKAAMFLPVSPELAYMKLRTNLRQDFLNKNDDAKDWLTKLAPFALVALLATLAIVGWLAVKLGGGGAA